MVRFGWHQPGVQQFLPRSPGTQTYEDLFGEFAAIENSLMRLTLIRCQRLERLNQFGCTIEIEQELRTSITDGLQKLVQIER